MGSHTPETLLEKGSPPEGLVCGVPGSLPDGFGGLSTTNRRSVSLGDRGSLVDLPNGDPGRKLFQWFRKSRLMLRINWNSA